MAGMSTRAGRRWRLLGIFLLLLAGVALFALDPLLESALRKVAASLEGGGQRVEFADVDVDLFGGGLRLEGLSIEPKDTTNVADSASYFTLQAEVVDLEDVEMWELLTKQVLRAHAFVIHAPSMRHSFATHKGGRVSPAGTKEKGSKAPASTLPAIRIDSLLISGAAMSSVDRAGVRPSVTVAGMDLLVKDVSLQVGVDNKPVLGRSEVRLDLRGIAADLPPLYRFTIDSLRTRYPVVTTQVYGMGLTPTVGPKEYHTKVEHSTDLMGVHADSLSLSGFSLLDQVQEGAYRAEAVLLYGGIFEIHHDKSIPDGPYKRKPLPSEALRALAVTISIDTVRAQHCEVRYSERNTRADEYGTLAFTDVDALLTGLSNAPDSAPADLHVQGSARIAGKAPASLDIRMPMGAGDPTVEIHAHVEDLSASLLNRMTDNLVNVNATAGRIHRMDMDMYGDDTGARGTMDMRYTDLHMELNNSVQHAGLFSKVANMVVRTNNMPHEKGYRKGYFTVQRKQDSSVFNYLWLCLKAGAMEVVLPNSVKKGMEKLGKKGKK